MLLFLQLITINVAVMTLYTYMAICFEEISGYQKIERNLSRELHHLSVATAMLTTTENH